MDGSNGTKALVVDDWVEHANEITHYLGTCGYAVVVLAGDLSNVPDRISAQCLHGIRYVFMDIHLQGGVTSGSYESNFAHIAGILEHVLAQDNGPWALVSYTSFSAESEGLFCYLRTRLPLALRPVTRAVIEKESIRGGSGELSVEDPEFIKQVRGAIQASEAASTLMRWEGQVARSTSAVLGDLWRTAYQSSQERSVSVDEYLAELVAALAKAQGDSLNAPIERSLYRTLTGLMEDMLECQNEKSNRPLSDPGAASAKSLSDDDRRRLETMLNYDRTWTYFAVPGALLSGNLNQLPYPVGEIAGSDDDLAAFIEKHFLQLHDSIIEEARPLLAQDCRILLLDATAPCDHAHGKAPWRRFVVTCQIFQSHFHYLTNRSKNNKKPFEPRKDLKGDYLATIGPLHHEEVPEPFVLVVNSHLTLSIRQDDLESGSLTVVGRVREQRMADIMHWLGGRLTRRGYLAL